MAWIWLLVAGVLEVCWAVGLKASEGLTRPAVSVLTVLAMVASFVCLSMATRTLPLGTAYTVWVGIGAAGATLAGWWLFDEGLGWRRVVWLVLLGVAIAGLKWEASPKFDTLSRHTTEAPLHSGGTS